MQSFCDKVSALNCAVEYVQSGQEVIARLVQHNCLNRLVLVFVFDLKYIRSLPAKVIALWHECLQDSRILISGQHDEIEMFIFARVDDPRFFPDTYPGFSEYFTTAPLLA